METTTNHIRRTETPLKSVNPNHNDARPHFKIERLPETFVKYGRIFKQQQRNGNIALFERFDFRYKRTDYEVIKIRSRQSGNRLQEYYPGSSQFGKYAFYFMNQEKAEKKFAELVDRK